MKSFGENIFVFFITCGLEPVSYISFPLIYDAIQLFFIINYLFQMFWFYQLVKYFTTITIHINTTGVFSLLETVERQVRGNV